MPMIRTGLAMILCAAATTAPAQTATPDSENGRYSFSQIGDELVRLDGRTGQVSTCGKRAAGWSCMAVPDERTALETEITRLQGESAALKKELLVRGVPLPSGIKPPAKAEDNRAEPALKLPSDAEMDRVVSFMEKLWRRLIEVVQGIQRDTDKRG